MASHFVALQSADDVSNSKSGRGREGSTYSDFTVGTSSSALALFELRVLDGVTPTRVEVIKALEAFERFFENAQQVSAAGFDVTG